MDANADTTTHNVRLLEAPDGERAYPPSLFSLSSCRGQVINSTVLYYRRHNNEPDTVFPWNIFGGSRLSFGSWF